MSSNKHITCEGDAMKSWEEYEEYVDYVQSLGGTPLFWSEDWRGDWEQVKEDEQKTKEAEAGTDTAQP